MNFEMTDEQRQLRDSVARLLRDVYGFEQRREFAASKDGYSPAVWRQLAELGVTGLPLPESHGGYGGGACDLMPVMQEFGKALVLEPLLASVVLGATAVRLAADDALKQELLPQVACGEVLLAWAHDESAGRHAPLWIETRAQQAEGAWLLNGAKANVLHAPAAQHVVVSARVSGEPDEPKGVALFLVDMSAQGIHCRAHRLVDDSSAGELRLQGAKARPLGDPGDAARAMAAIQGTLGVGIAAVCADVVGAMEAAFRLAVEYLNTRKQFGRLIGENQVLRHRAAEMQVALEMARSMAIAAAVAVDNRSGEASRADLLRAKLVIGRQARQLCQQAIQLHGGIGMTEEYAVGHYLRRVTLMDQLFGDSETQASRLAHQLA